MTKLAEREAQELHDLRRDADPDHDRSSCWCCCCDCDFDTRAVMGSGMKSWKTLDEVRADLDRLRDVIPRMKGRRYKARVRANVRWRRDPVVRCECGRPDKFDNVSASIRICPFGNCNQLYCPACGRQNTAWGPVGCRCDHGRTGHRRYAEQPKPHVKVKR